jgi:hypothetical protein
MCCRLIHTNQYGSYAALQREEAGTQRNETRRASYRKSSEEKSRLRSDRAIQSSPLGGKPTSEGLVSHEGALASRIASSGGQLPHCVGPHVALT